MSAETHYTLDKAKIVRGVGGYLRGGALTSLLPGVGAAGGDGVGPGMAGS